MTEFILAYITCKSMAEAEEVGTALVMEKLAACVNIMPGMTSVYEWQGKIEKAEEVALLVKTRVGLFGQLEMRVKELHSYDNPCIISWSLNGGSAEYLKWMGMQVENANN